jgi:single-stranded-DNA-specific exonuclease
VASRIKDAVHRPTIAFAASDETELKGSGRSIAGIHLRDILAEVGANHPGLLTKFGGHAMAAGLTLARDKLPVFQQAFKATVARHLTSELMSPDLLSDGELFAEQFSIEHAHAIREAGPWGQNFPEPVFHGTFRVVDQKLLAQKHLRLVLCPDEFREVLVDAIAFNVDLEVWPNTAATAVQIVYSLDVNSFRGRTSLQLIIKDIVVLRD